MKKTGILLAAALLFLAMLLPGCSNGGKETLYVLN